MAEHLAEAVDVAIRGAGPVGCVLALALRESGLSVRLVGRTPSNAVGDSAARLPFRPLALSYASRLILERVGAWDGLSTTAIDRIHVSQAGGFGRTKLSSDDLNLPALGYVADYEDVAAHVAALVDPTALCHDDARLPPARLVVHAEGTSSEMTRGKDYAMTAIVASVEADRAPHGVAWERFTSEGPLALLPLNSRYGLVWSCATGPATGLMSLDDDAFLAALQTAFGRRAGRFCAVGPRAATSLALRYRSSRARPGEVHIGNAAQTLHPVAGQGLNLGLRDAWDLARLLHVTRPHELASSELAGRYSRMRRLDSEATMRATDLMATLFLRQGPVSSALRGAALTALDIFPPARRAFARRMIYGASAW